MLYAKLTDNGDVQQYPYTLLDLKRDNSNVSFSSSVTDTELLEFNVVPVNSVASPIFLYDKDLIRTVERTVDGGYTEAWAYVDADPLKIAEREETESTVVRVRRNQLLFGSDWTQLPDSPVDSVVWAAYRQDLRDIPQQVGFPWTVTWPTEPT